MTEQASKVISTYVQSVVNDNKNQFEDVLMSGVTTDMSTEQILTKMIFNSITLSADLSTQIILQLLEDSNLLSINSDEHTLQKLSLKLHTDTLKK